MMQGLNWQTLQIPLAAGVNQKADSRALQPPELTICKDVRFDELGGLQTRHGFAAPILDIVGGGTLSNFRRIVQNGSELLVFTKDALYSWNTRQSKWVLRATHLAAKVDETTRFAATSDQIDCDRIEFDDTIFYAWSWDSSVYVAAIDKDTDSVVCPPTQLLNWSRTRPRFVALSDTLLLFTWNVSADRVGVLTIDPDDIATSLEAAADPSPTNIGATIGGAYYDVCRVGTGDVAAVAQNESPSTSYTVTLVASDLTTTVQAKARTCDGPIAVSSNPTGTRLQVIRGDGTNVEGDLLNATTLADVFTDQAIGTVASACQQIAAAHRTVQDSSQYRCYVFWSDSESSTPGCQVKYNWVDTNNTLGTEATFVKNAGVASRAFDHEGSIFVNLVFAGESSAVNNVFGLAAQLQNTYFLYRDDVSLVAKMAPGRAGGFVASTSCLPNVQSLGSGAYAWCGSERRIVPLGGNHSGYADRGPRDVVITFDSNEARRCARLGRTLYITGGELLQYDGVRLAEVGFHLFPYYFGLNSSSGGNIEDGAYYYKATTRWDNAQGELDRSTTATVGGITENAGPEAIDITSLAPLSITHKTADPVALAVEIWRTLKNPTDDSPFYLVTNKDPSDLSGANRYIVNDPAVSTLASFSDAFSDDEAREGETNPENGGVLENIAPPACTIIMATDARLFLAGIAGDPDRVWYSKQRNDGEVAAFHDALTVPIPTEGGDITGLGFLLDTLVVFREHAVYVLPGDGFDNTGNGVNFGPARQLSSDLGAVNHESIALTDQGLVFHSSKGKYLLTKGWSLEYIGGPVSDYDEEDVLAVHSVESKHQVRWFTENRILVLDTLVGQWSEWSIDAGLSATVWRGTYVVMTNDGPRLETPDGFATSVDEYGIDVETAWIKLNDLQGFGRIRKLLILGEIRGFYSMRIRIARDYATTYFQDKTYSDNSSNVGFPLELQHNPSIQQLKAIKVRITVSPVLGGEDTGEAVKLTGIGFEVGIKRGLFPFMPATSKTSGDTP